MRCSFAAIDARNAMAVIKRSFSKEVCWGCSLDFDCGLQPWCGCLATPLCFRLLSQLVPRACPTACRVWCGLVCLNARLSSTLWPISREECGQTDFSPILFPLLVLVSVAGGGMFPFCFDLVGCRSAHFLAYAGCWPISCCDPNVLWHSPLLISGLRWHDLGGNWARRMCGTSVPICAAGKGVNGCYTILQVFSFADISISWTMQGFDLSFRTQSAFLPNPKCISFLFFWHFHISY